MFLNKGSVYWGMGAYYVEYGVAKICKYPLRGSQSLMFSGQKNLRPLQDVQKNLDNPLCDVENF